MSNEISTSQHSARYLVYGVASDASLAWAIAREVGEAGAAVTLAYQARFRSRVQGLVKDHDWIEDVMECDVASEDSVRELHERLRPPFHGVVHAVAFAPAEALAKPITETTEDDFHVAVGVSAYSLVRVVRHVLPMLAPQSSIVTLTYLGADRVVPSYRVMGTAKAALESLVRELAASIGPGCGHRVNAISAGPVKTLAAGGIPGFDRILDWMANATPLRRNVTQDDIARVARFLLSEDSAAITGQVIYADAGYSAVGVPPELDRVFVEPRLDPYEASV
jgi:enoyl-[acyl-carrier protein] reductase I